jgi:hypothetical protein
VEECFTHSANVLCDGAGSVKPNSFPEFLNVRGGAGMSVGVLKPGMESIA